MQQIADIVKFSVEGGFWHFLGVLLVVGAITSFSPIRVTINKKDK